MLDLRAPRVVGRAKRAQTEVLGFALLFGTVLLVVLLVTATASGGLLSARDDRRVANAEVTMSGFADNVDDLTRGEAPSRSTQFDLDGGRLSLGPPATLTVNTTDGTSETVGIRPLVYRAADGTELVYLNGAVVRDDGHGTATIDGSTQVVSEDRVALTVVRFSADRNGAGAIGGDSTVSVSTVRTRSAVVATGGATTVTLELSSPYAAAWAQELGDADGVTCSVVGETATCTVDTDRVSVAVIDVKVRFD